ncbi:hypothetical protein [Halobacillus yeomjeoni]|uniref:Histidine kinase-, DNA gyrase B-, and HSP90-like ATPase n=1 Tax=Halobacillus yeomjeoni TaxID=311194 RepID=A0A931HXL6_9BACI|nr:hypothetical protein [Halobacillus yeomjeoni]MBH0231378.1 hypothetical protein [Halobacillus yeomjeoni]
MTLLSVDIAKVDRMAQTGSSLLRLIQNDELPILDLLVRESLQNSLDAKKAENSHVNVDLSIQGFKKDTALKHFQGLTDTFAHEFPSEEQKSLVIRDSNTVGLTGPLSYEEMDSREEQGNMLNLVYEIGRPQQKEGAGGSWGLGKTVYFRAGVGLVIYYSRIRKEDGTFESRLAACLIENEEKDRKSTFIPYKKEEKLKRGIAWWGVPQGDKTVPLTGKEEIQSILEDFNIEPYTGEETGTTVIIPFIREKNLLTEKIGEEQKPLPWHSSIEKYLNVSVQRWYAPRLDNQHYPHGGWLKCAINKETITKDSMEPAFKVLQSLYNRTLKVKEENDILKDSEVYVESIKTRNVLKKAEAGKISFALVKRDVLRMTVPDNLASPYKYFDIPNVSDVENSPIISHTRKPGMIVSYNTSGSWVERIQAQNEDEFLIGIFVPNSNNPVIDSHFKNNAATLEAYLRKSEKADHRSWSDYFDNGKSLNLVSRIQTTMTRRVNQKIDKQEKDVKNVKDNQLSSVVGKALLPPRGYGKNSNKKPSSRKETGNGPAVSKTKNFVYTIDSVKPITLYQTEIQFSIESNKKPSKAQIELAATAERDTIKADKWESEDGTGTTFPFIIEDIVVDGEADVQEVTTVESGRSYAEKLSLNSSAKVTGKMTVRSQDPLIQMKILMVDLTESESMANE